MNVTVWILKILSLSSWNSAWHLVYAKKKERKKNVEGREKRNGGQPLKMSLTEPVFTQEQAKSHHPCSNSSVLLHARFMSQL